MRKSRFTEARIVGDSQRVSKPPRKQPIADVRTVSARQRSIRGARNTVASRRAICCGLSSFEEENDGSRTSSPRETTEARTAPSSGAGPARAARCSGAADLPLARHKSQAIPPPVACTCRRAFTAAPNRARPGLSALRIYRLTALLRRKGFADNHKRIHRDLCRRQATSSQAREAEIGSRTRPG